MRIKELYKWQMPVVLKSMAVYCLMIILIFIFFGAIFAITVSSSGEAQSFGMTTSMNSFVYMFVMGIVCYAEGFKFSLCNGVSRKTIIVTSIFTYASAAFLLSLFEILSTLVLGAIAAGLGIGDFLTENMFEMLFKNYPADAFLQILSNFLITFLGLILISFVGVFISALNGRMSTRTRLLVYIGVPAILFLGLPLTFKVLTAPIREFFTEMFVSLFNFISASPITGGATMLLLIVVFWTLSYLCIRRAPLKTV